MLLINHLCAIAIIILCSFAIIKNIKICVAYIASDNIYKIALNKDMNGLQPTTSYGCLNHSLFCDYLVKNDVNLLELALQKTSITNCSYRSSKIILVVGESFNKYHSNLYNYKHITNPKLAEENKRQNLYVFQDVITPYCATSYVMQSIFSFKNQDNDTYWAETPLFPKFFKENGYHTSFFSNQEVRNQDYAIWDTANHFLISEVVTQYCYTTTNMYKYRWDQELVEEYKSCKNHIKYENHFAIFHLNGQHVAYSQRYHNDETLFTVEDYQYRTDLTQNQREMVAHYDNATAYNDKVVTHIIDLYRDQNAIIIYLSDHGEEVHDYRDFIGRTPISAKPTPKIFKYQYEIPFMIWMSDEYKATHPDVVQQVENSLDKPFMIDDLPHLMLDIAGIECEWFDPTRSLINERYNSNRKRLLLDSKIDYDEMITQLK